MPSLLAVLMFGALLYLAFRGVSKRLENLNERITELERRLLEKKVN